MKSLRDLSIKRKLTLIIMLISSVALLLACASFISYDLITSRRAMVRDLQTQAEMIGLGSTAALSFNDQKYGQEILTALAAKPQIISACIYEDDNQPFAKYLRGSETADFSPPEPQMDGSHFGNHSLVLFRRIVLNGETVGTVYLESDLEELRSRMKRYAVIVAIIMAGSLCVALLLSSKLQRVISEPIVHLAKTAKIVSTEKNYAVRAVSRSLDEMGVLIDGFNEMLAQIQARDEQLQHRNESLQAEIGERQRIEQALRESEKRLLDLFENSPDAIFVEDLDGYVLDVNPAACRLHSLVRGSLIGKHFLDLVPADKREEVANNFTKQTRSELEQVESLSWNADERAIPVEIRANRINYVGRPALLLHVRDITERKQAEVRQTRLEAQLRQSQKMEAIGTLAGGIAHDFNNILAAIIGYCELAMIDLPESDPTQTHLMQVMKGSNRAKELVRQILTFSRQEEHQRKPIQLQSVVDEALNLLRATLPSTIELRRAIDPQAPPILGDPTQIHQVMMNLGTNAWHAMHESGGTLEVNLTTFDVDADFVRTRPDLHEGRYLRLMISDTGCGMDRATLERVFEPFFTTKAPGAGTGLGLAVVHGVVKRHEGAISVYSEPGEGTTFNLYFPVHEFETQAALPEPTSIPMGNGERILFVDDEVPLATLGKAMLERLGYRVTVQTSSLEALATFTAQSDQFDLVITDQTMPGLSGAELARLLLEIRPELPVILATGYSTTINPEKAQAMGIREMLVKPNTRQSLGEAIWRALGTNGKGEVHG
jgi:PAS domain S-box-containing protein